MRTILKAMFGWGIVGTIDFLYDFPVWIWLQQHFGLVVGSAYASLGAMILNVIYLTWYQASGQDWLGVSILEEIKREGESWSDKMCDYKGSLFYRIALFVPVYLPAKIFRLVVWSLNKTELLTFFVFSSFTDSFKTTVFMRHGRMGKLDWQDVKVFVSSTVVSCILWSAFNATLGEVAHLISACWKVVFD